MGAGIYTIWWYTDESGDQVLYNREINGKIVEAIENKQTEVVFDRMKPDQTIEKYSIDLNAMIQKNLQTNEEIKIGRHEVPLLKKYWFMNSAGFEENYDEYSNAMLNWEHDDKMKPVVNLVIAPHPEDKLGYEYSVDFNAMTQTNLTTKTVRKIGSRALVLKNVDSNDEELEDVQLDRDDDNDTLASPDLVVSVPLPETPKAAKLVGMMRQWYFINEKGIKQNYDEDINEELEQCMQMGKEEIKFSKRVPDGKCWDYVINLTKRTQKNISSWTVRNIGFNEVPDPRLPGPGVESQIIQISIMKTSTLKRIFEMCDPSVKITYSRIGRRMRIQGEAGLVAKTVLQISNYALKNPAKFIKAPPHWECPQDGDLAEYDVSDVSSEYQEVVGKLKKTLPDALNIRVQRVQNLHLWQKFSTQRHLMGTNMLGSMMLDQSMADPRLDSKYLFHGTRKVDPSLIKQGGFDLRLSAAGYWGNAIYFAEDASYSHAHYLYKPGNGDKQMFMAAVLLGDMHVMANRNSSLKRPPPKGDDPCVLFDSIQGDIDGQKVYMVYDSAQCYPQYLITYN